MNAYSLILLISALFLVPPQEIRHSFDDYPADTSATTRATKVRYQDKGMPRFRTKIGEALKSGPNFAGHYTVNIWGCGTGCKVGVVVDVESGKAWWIPPKISSEGARYRLDSRLIIINPPPPEKTEWAGQLPPKYTYYYEWNAPEFRLIDSVLITN